METLCKYLGRIRTTLIRNIKNFVVISRGIVHIVAYLRHASKNCNIETRSRDYATVDEAIFSVPSRAVTSRASRRIASLRLLPGNSYKHLDDARVGKGHVTASEVTSRVSIVTQQLKRFPRARSRVYRRD
jgi:hypothetical protein